MVATQPDSLAKTDQSLDGCLSACWLKEPTIAELVENAMFHFDGDPYRLLAWCIMPNHVHVVWNLSTETAWAQCSGPFWHKDYFDRFIRDEGHLARTTDYVETTR